MHSLVGLVNSHCHFENLDIYYSFKTLLHWHISFSYPIRIFCF